MCIVMLASLASILSACDGDVDITTTSASTTESTTTTTTENSTTTVDSLTTTTQGDATTTTTQGGTTTTTKKPISASPFDNQRCLVLQVRSVRQGVLQGIILQNTYTAAGKTDKNVGDDIRIEFTSNAKLYKEDGVTPIGAIKDGCFEYGDVVMVTLGASKIGIYTSVNGDFISCHSSDAMRELSSWGERLNLMLRYKEKNPNLKTTYYETQLSEGYYKEIVNYASDGDSVYVLLTPGRLVEINSNTGQIVKDAPLSPEPKDMRVYGNEIWVSFGSERVIGIFDKSSFDLIRTIVLPLEVHSFDVSGDCIFYAESDYIANMYRYNMTTGANDRFSGDWRMVNPKLLVNAEDNRVYATQSTSIIVFDMDTLAQIDGISKPIGESGVSKKMVLYGNSLYWDKYKMNDTDLDVNKKYATVKDASCSVLSVSKNYINASNGIYDRSSLEWLISLPNSHKSMTVVTSSGNIVILRGNTIDVVKR